jgi:hypothetical protein
MTILCFTLLNHVIKNFINYKLVGGKDCSNRGGISRLCIYKQGENEKLVHRCTRRTCRIKIPLFTLTTHLLLHRYLFYLFINFKL